MWSGKLDYDAGRKDRAQGKLTKLNETHQDAFSQIALGNMYDYQHSIQTRPHATSFHLCLLSVHKI